MYDKLTTDSLDARRELTAKKLADLELQEESEGVAVSALSGAIRISDAWGPSFESTGKWTVSGRVADVPGSFSDFHEAVDAAHAAKFPERQPLDEATFGRLLEEGQRDMKAFEAERRTGFPRKSEGRTADLNEPITHTEPDVDAPKPVRNPRIKIKIGLFYDVKTVADIEKMLRDGRALPSDRLWIFGKDAGTLEETRPQWAELLADDANHDADGGHCQTSELDLLRAENEHLRQKIAADNEAAINLLKAALKEQEQLKLHWIDNAQRWEKLASNQANQIAKPKEAADHSTCERIFESLRAALAARNQDYESLKDAHRGLLNRQPVATFDAEKRVWTVQVGILTVQVAKVVDNVTAVIDGLGFLGSVTIKASVEHLIPLVGHMLSFCGIRVQE